MPGSLIYSDIFIEDTNYGQEGNLQVFCNQYASGNSDVKNFYKIFQISTHLINQRQKIIMFQG
jgi:hypothetical protein